MPLRSGLGFQQNTFPVSLDKFIQMVTETSGLISSGFKWQFVTGTPEGTIALKVWGEVWVAWKEGAGV